MQVELICVLIQNNFYSMFTFSSVKKQNGVKTGFGPE